MYDFAEDYTCKLKFDVYIDSNGNIIDEGVSASGKKSFTFGGFTSSITAAETVNDDDDDRENRALYNGISGLMWLFTGREDNFDKTSVKKISTAVIDDE